MTDKEKFIRFKNRLLGPMFMNDGTHFAEILGRDHFMFWSYLEEKAPYLPPTIPLSNVTKGQIILERIEIEPSPKRMADLLQAVYNTYAFYSTTPRADFDDHWRQFANWLQDHIQSIGFTDMKTKWIEKPEECFTPPPIVERYYMPGDLKITYAGQDWGEEESKKILENGFTSRVLEAARNAKPVVPEKISRKTFFEKTLGKIVIGVVIGIIVAGVTFWLGWR